MTVAFQGRNTKSEQTLKGDLAIHSTHAGLVGEYLSMQEKKIGETCSHLWQQYSN
jgi:hypothetical protein